MATKRTWAVAPKVSPLLPAEERPGTCTCGETRCFQLKVQAGEMMRICLRCGKELRV